MAPDGHVPSEPSCTIWLLNADASSLMLSGADQPYINVLDFHDICGLIKLLDPCRYDPASGGASSIMEKPESGRNNDSQGQATTSGNPAASQRCDSLEFVFDKLYTEMRNPSCITKLCGRDSY